MVEKQARCWRTAEMTLYAMLVHIDSEATESGKLVGSGNRLKSELFSGQKKRRDKVPSSSQLSLSRRKADCFRQSFDAESGQNHSV